MSEVTFAEPTGLCCDRFFSSFTPDFPIIVFGSEWTMIADLLLLAQWTMLNPRERQGKSQVQVSRHCIVTPVAQESGADTALLHSTVYPSTSSDTPTHFYSEIPTHYHTTHSTHQAPWTSTPRNLSQHTDPVAPVARNGESQRVSPPGRNDTE